MALARARRGGGINYWPGFVDALTTLLLAIIFLLSVFVLGQFFLGQELTNRDTVLERLNRQIAELTDLLALERSGRRNLEGNVASLEATLRAGEQERGRLQGVIDTGGVAQTRANELNTALQAERQATARAQNAIELLNQQLAALRRQLAAVEEALSASENRDRESQARIADLGSRLNVALAQRVQELARYRSDFFGRLRQILGERPDVRIASGREVARGAGRVPPRLGRDRRMRGEEGTTLRQRDRVAAHHAQVGQRRVPADLHALGGDHQQVVTLGRHDHEVRAGHPREHLTAGRARPRVGADPVPLALVGVDALVLGDLLLGPDGLVRLPRGGRRAGLGARVGDTHAAQG